MASYLEGSNVTRMNRKYSGIMSSNHEVELRPEAILVADVTVVELLNPEIRVIVDDNSMSRWVSKRIIR